MMIYKTDESKAKRRLFIETVCALVFIICIAYILVIYLKSTGIYPRGTDMFGHIFRSNFLYESINQGDYFPLYIKYWYNGVQAFRYTGPLSYYILAGLQFIAGNPMDSYLLFVGVSFGLGAIGWLLFGIKYNRILFCTFLGVIWFLLPHNANIAFAEGNFPRMVINIFLPYLFYFVWNTIEHKKYGSIFYIILFTIMISLCHLMIAAMVGISTFIFTLIYSIANKKIRESFYVIIGMLISFAMIGIWIYPALKGGMVSMNNSSIVELSSAPISVSLNPFLRLAGRIEDFYFGLSFFVLSVFGIVLSDKKRIAGFITLLIIFFGTTTALVPIIVKLPMGEFLWMQRFTPIAYTLLFISLIEWKKCKKIVSLIFCFVLVLDTMTSLTYINLPFLGNPTTTYERQQKISQEYGLNYAKEIVSQRIAYMDQSRTGSFPSYKISAEDPEKQYSFGWVWQSAQIASNIMLLNTSLEQGHFNYMFDRCIELGNDTVVVRKDQLPKLRNVNDKLFSSASLLGYNLMKQNQYVFIFQKDTPKTFGVVTNYQGLAIGNAASQISLIFPYFEKGKSISLTDYSFDELVKYKKIYLSDFNYNDKSKAEAMVNKLTQNGVQIFIDMNRVPYDSTTQRMNFMGVTSQDISFNTQLPTLVYNNNKVNTDIFKEEYNTWNTVFLENVKNVTGHAEFEGTKLTFSGTGENKNLYFIGFNIMYHAMETRDEGALIIVKDIFKLKEDMLPKRILMPINISYEGNTIKIDSPNDNLNTTIAYHDIFRSENTIINSNNLLVVNKGKTEIFFVYPYLTVGIIISIVGFIAFAVFICFIFKYENKKISDIWFRIKSKRNSVE